jgi:hypothetical protein
MQNETGRFSRSRRTASTGLGVSGWLRLIKAKHKLLDETSLFSSWKALASRSSSDP